MIDHGNPLHPIHMNPIPMLTKFIFMQLLPESLSRHSPFNNAPNPKRCTAAPNPIPTPTVSNGLLMPNPPNVTTTLLHTPLVMARNFKKMKFTWATSDVMMTNGPAGSNGHENIHTVSKLPMNSEKKIVQSPAIRSNRTPCETSPQCSVIDARAFQPKP